MTLASRGLGNDSPVSLAEPLLLALPPLAGLLVAGLYCAACQAATRGSGLVYRAWSRPSAGTSASRTAPLPSSTRRRTALLLPAVATIVGFGVYKAAPHFPARPLNETAAQDLAGHAYVGGVSLKWGSTSWATGYRVYRDERLVDTVAPGLGYSSRNDRKPHVFTVLAVQGTGRSARLGRPASVACPQEGECSPATSPQLRR